ncbi:DUF664 domain-containing protein [Kribbella sp. VKM Ac-2566]|uniref:mycothiol transferase n=1 Tax=Kribbella sp. VKM Ac-2566 TaxID=2512218 RepID=UPI00192E0630|nr:DUF664 domain-containing protein [Kribbella sp. VKM Ac-2566]
MTTELDQLVATLDSLRAGVLKKLAGLTETACAASNEIIAKLADPETPVTRNGKTHNLRWAILAVIGETSRHAGHADIIREQLDGTTGR